MKSQDLVLLPLTQQGTPSGNYDGSSLAFNGDRQKAADYYRTSSGTQTLMFALNGLQGRITIQATLDADPQVDLDWFDVYEVDATVVTSYSTFSHTVRGNFTWIRARVTEFLNGTITSVTVTY